MSQSQAGTQDKEMDGDGYMDSIIKHYVAHWHSKFDMNMIMFICQSAVGGRQHCTRIVTCIVVNVLPDQGEAIQLLK